MADIEIRDFRPDDLAFYLQLSEQFYATNAVSHTVPIFHFRETFQKCLEASPFVRGLALLFQQQFAGYGLLSFTWSNEAGGMVVLLEEAYISPAYQGCGLGSAFLRFVEEAYRDFAKRLRLEVTSSNQGALRLYERQGYQRIDYIQMMKEPWQDR